VYPEDTKIQSRLSTNGILMGLPLTWVTLNLMQLFWVEQSALDVGASVKETRLNTRICGDDLLGHWSTRQIQAYEELVIRSNGKFSEGKHFKSKDFLVFTEIIKVSRGVKKMPLG